MKERQKSSFAREELWIGLAKVEQSSGNGVLGDTEGAYTNAIAIADGRASFRSKVKDALADLDLRLIGLEDAETLNARLSKYSLDAELRKVAKAAKDTGQVGFGTFHEFEAK